MGIETTAGWLKQVFARFDDDVKLLHRTEPFWQPCQKCPDGDCCGHNGYLNLKGAINPFYLVEWWLMLEYVRDHFDNARRNQLAHNILSKRSHCIFLFGKRCSVYPNRPWGSRIHPYTISFYDKDSLFPSGGIMLPSCGKYVMAFGIKTGSEVIQQPEVVDRNQDGKLVQLKIRKHKPLWYIDASAYVAELDTYLSEGRRNPNPSQSPWNALQMLAEAAGGEHGKLLKIYLEKTLGLSN